MSAQFETVRESAKVELERPSIGLLDQIVAEQARAAARYQPVMTTEQAISRMKEIRKLKELVLVEKEDYGIIPGTDKPTLLKPGAEKICAFFGYVPDYDVMAGSIEDWTGQDHDGEPLFYYHIKCTLLKDGSPVGQGLGSCNSWETKYRYRLAKRLCPSCGSPSIIVGKEEYGGGFICFQKKGGCGAKFKSSDPAIINQTVGRIANQDIADVINTVQKIGTKRAYIAATLSATGASQWFTQDVGDNTLEPENPKAESEKPKATTSAPVTPFDEPAIPEALRLMYLELANSFDATVALFGQFKVSLRSLTNSDHYYYEILGRGGMQHGNDLKGKKRGDVKKVVAELYAAVEKLRAEPLPPSDENRNADDLPIGGANGE